VPDKVEVLRVEAAGTGDLRDGDDRGPTGFQPSTLIFPTAGCWKVTGRIDDRASLTFVTDVAIRAS
jgi:hypothetical protein